MVSVEYREISETKHYAGHVLDYSVRNYGKTTVKNLGFCQVPSMSFPSFLYYLNQLEC